MRSSRYERKHERPIPQRAFAKRIAWHLGISAIMVVVSLVIGMVGFKATEPTMTWLDAYLDTAMLLGGMGPVGELRSDSAKFFGGTYALYAGLVVILVTAIMLAPVVHRVMHRFHWDTKSEEE